MGSSYTGGSKLPLWVRWIRGAAHSHAPRITTLLVSPLPTAGLSLLPSRVALPVRMGMLTS